MESNIDTKLCLEWGNSLLAEVNMAVTMLADFQEASVLSLLIDILWPASRLQSQVQALSGESNIKQLHVIFNHLQSIKVKHSITPEGLLNGGATSLLDLMWTLILHLCIHTPKVSPFQRNVKMGQRSILNWCRQELPYMTVDHMDSLTNNVCHDGMLIDLLCRFCSVEHDPDPVQYLKNCLKTAQDELSISENILEPVAVIDGSVDETALLIYLALLRRKVKQRSQGGGQLGSGDNSGQQKLDGVSTRPQILHEVKHDIAGHSDQPSPHMAETNSGGQSVTDTSPQCCHDDSCLDDSVPQSWEEGTETGPYPRNHCCNIWCGDDNAGSCGTVVMATEAPLEKRLHKIGQVVRDSSSESQESIEVSLEIGDLTDEPSQEPHVMTLNIQDDEDGDQGHDLQPPSDIDSGVAGHREATSESESGIESNWGNSTTHDLDGSVSCEGHYEGHLDSVSCSYEMVDTSVGQDIGTNRSVSRKTSSVTLGDDTLREDMNFDSDSDSDTTLHGSEGKDVESGQGWTRVDSPDRTCAGGESGSRSGGCGGSESDALDYVYTSKIYVTLSDKSGQSDLSLPEPVSSKDGNGCGFTRQRSLFDELQQVEHEFPLQTDTRDGSEMAESMQSGRDRMSFSDTFGLQLSGQLKTGDIKDNVCCQGYTETVMRETNPPDRQTELNIKKTVQNVPETKTKWPETQDIDVMSCDDFEREDSAQEEEEECLRDGGEAMGRCDSVDIVTDLSYEDSFEESPRDNDTEDCCIASAESSESETTSVHNPQCTASPVDDDQRQTDDLQLDLARDIMVDDVSVTSEDPADWMDASMNSLIASANRDWLQQNILSESAQLRNEEFAALQKALMMRTIQCVVSEQLSLGTLGQSVGTNPDNQEVYFVSNDDVGSTQSHVVAPNVCPTGSDELLHLLDMIGMQGQEMRKELVMSQTREAHLQEEMLNEDEQLVEVVDGLQQELSVLKEDNVRLHDELVLNKMLKSQYAEEIESLKGVVRRLCGHIENLEVEVKKMHADMTPRRVTKNASMVTELPCRFNFAMQTECDIAKVTLRDAECQGLSPETVDSCLQTMLESALLDDVECSCPDDAGERMSNNMTAMIDKILQQMANMTGMSGASVSSTPMYSHDADDDWQATKESDCSDATVDVMKQHLANAVLQYDLTKSELERKNSVLQQEAESSATRLGDLERELKKARDENDVLKVLTEGDKAEMDILKDKIAMMGKAVSSAQNENERLNLRLETTLSEVSMTMPTHGAELKEKMAELETDKKQLEQTLHQIHEENSRGTKTVTALQRSLVESEDQKDRLWTEVKILLEEYGLLKTDVDTMENILQQHAPELYGSVTIRGKRHGHTLVRSLSELKHHVFGDKKPSDLGISSDGSLHSLHNAPELSLQAPRDTPETAATIHENIMKQSQLVLNNIDDVHVDKKPCAPVVNWQDVCQSIASQLDSESGSDRPVVTVPLDTTKVMPLFNMMLKELDIQSEPSEAARMDPLQPCLPRQVLGLAKTMETEMGLSSTSSTQSLSAVSAGSMVVDPTGVKAETHGEDRSSASSDRSHWDYERVNQEYEELKKKRLHLLIEAYTGNPDPDALIARARGQGSTPAYTGINPSPVASKGNTNGAEIEAVKKLEASRARMFAMREKLRLSSMEYRVSNTPSDNAPVGDISQSTLDVTSRRRLAEAMSVQEYPQRQDMVDARPWKKTVDSLNDNTRPNGYFSMPLMSSSPREETPQLSYVGSAERVQNVQPFYSQQHRQIYPHKKGYKTAEEFADGKFISDVVQNAGSDNYVESVTDNGVKYSPVVHRNSDSWHREKRCVPSQQGGVYWTQGDNYFVTHSCRDQDVTECEDTDKGMESLVSRQGDMSGVTDTAYNWRQPRQVQSCWNLTNHHIYSDVTSRHDRGHLVMTIPDHCHGLTQHSQSLVDISSTQALTDASETESRLDLSAQSATELHCTDTSLQESDHLDMSVCSDDSPQLLRRQPNNVYHVQERHRGHVHIDNEDPIADIRHGGPTFERSRDERLKTYAKHDSMGGIYIDKSQSNDQNSSIADNTVNTRSADWTSYYQRKCRALKVSDQDVLVTDGRPDVEYRISAESNQVAFKNVEKGQTLSEGEGKYKSRLGARDIPKRSGELKDVHTVETVSGSRGKPACPVTTWELYESSRCEETQINSYSRDDHPKTVTFSDGAAEAHRKLIYPDAPTQREPRETLKNSTPLLTGHQQNKEEKSKEMEVRPRNRHWEDEDGDKIESNRYSWRDKELVADEGVLRDPPSHVSSPLKEQHIHMLNARRLSVHRDDDSSTSMSDVDFVVMRSGDIVRRRKKGKGRKKDASETATRRTVAEEGVNNDRGHHPNLDAIAEGKKCLEEEEDYFGDYKSLQLVSGTTKADNNVEPWTEAKRRVGFSSEVRCNEDPYWAETKRHDGSRLTGVSEHNDTLRIASPSSVKRSAAAALQLERDLVAAGKLMEEIEKCKMVDLSLGKRQSDIVTNDTKTQTNVINDVTKLKTQTNVDTKLKFSDKESVMKQAHEDTPQKKEEILLDEMKESVLDVPERKGPVLTEEQKKYANELIDKYAYQWEQTRNLLLPPSEQVPCVLTASSEKAEVLQSTTTDDGVENKVEDSASDDNCTTSEVNGNTKVRFEVDEIVTRYNQEWLSRQQVVTAGGNQ